MSEQNVVKNATRSLISKGESTDDDIELAIRCILSVDVPDSTIAAFLTALTMSGIRANYVRIARNILREESISFSLTGYAAIDNCGTGGASIRTFNISTAAAIIAASADCVVAKHGNKSASGICGSADFFEQIGFDLNRPTEDIVDSIKRIGLCFLFAQKFHPKLKRISSIRNQIGFKTIFNILGPLTSPCSNLAGQVIGVPDSTLIEIMQSVVSNLDIDNVIMVHSEDGLGELSNTSVSRIVKIKKSNVEQYRFTPKEIKMPIASLQNIMVSSMEDSVRSTMQVIYGVAPRAKEDIVLLNSAIALLVGKKVDSIGEGVEVVRHTLRSDAPRIKLRNLIELCGNPDILSKVEKKFRLDT
jgi:anthranilate phosphoribosyltransferase